MDAVNYRSLSRVSLVVLFAIAVVLLSSSPAFARYGARSIITDVETGETVGHMVIAPTAANHGTFAAEMTIVLHGTASNTTFAVQRARDPRGSTADGVCSNTAYGQYENETVTTRQNGNGSTHIHYVAPFPSGETFDVRFQFEGSDGTILQTECMTITVK